MMNLSNAAPGTDPALLVKADVPDIGKCFRGITARGRLSRLRGAVAGSFNAGHAPGRLEFTDIKTGRFVTIDYAKKRDFDLGELYTSQGFVTFAVKKEFSGLLDSGLMSIGGLVCAKDEERDPCVPQAHSTHESEDRLFMILRKNPAPALLAPAPAQAEMA